MTSVFCFLICSKCDNFINELKYIRILCNSRGHGICMCENLFVEIWLTQKKGVAKEGGINACNLFSYWITEFYFKRMRISSQNQSIYIIVTWWVQKWFYIATDIIKNWKTCILKFNFDFNHFHNFWRHFLCNNYFLLKKKQKLIDNFFLVITKRPQGRT